MRMLSSHSAIYSRPEPHLLTPLAHLGFYDTVDKAPFDHLQAQVENLEARVRSYEVGGPTIQVWNSTAETVNDPIVEEELEKLKQRISGETRPAKKATAVAEPAAVDRSQEEG